MDCLDTRGTFCPIPILLTAKRIASMAPGERLEVLGDDPAILEDMPIWCSDSGHSLLEIERIQDVVRCVVEKAPTAP